VEKPDLSNLNNRMHRSQLKPFTDFTSCVHNVCFGRMRSISLLCHWSVATVAATSCPVYSILSCHICLEVKRED